MESIGNSIINELTGPERDHLKEKLLLSCAKHKNSNHHSSLSSPKMNLKQLLTDLNVFNGQNQQPCCTVVIDDNDVKACTTTNINEMNIPINQNCNTNMLNEETQLISETTKRKKKQDNKGKTKPTIMPRTICTRSSKLNSLNNNNDHG